MSLTSIYCLLFIPCHDMLSWHGVTFVRNVNDTVENETNNKQYIDVNDISTVSLTFLTNVAAYHESISRHGMNNKQYIGVNVILTISLKFTVIPK
jgi:hypothetical protein